MIVKKRSLTHLKQKQKRPFFNLFLFGLMAMGFHNSKFEITPYGSFDSCMQRYNNSLNPEMSKYLSSAIEDRSKTFLRLVT